MSTHTGAALRFVHPTPDTRTRLLHRMLASAALLCAFLLTSCSNSYFTSPLYLAVTISPRPSSVPVGGSVVLTGTVTNNLSIPTWTILDAANTSNPGTLTAVAGQPNSVLYTAPAAPPIYTGVAAGFAQGAVTVHANVVPPAGASSLPDAQDSVSVVITAPTVTVGISPAAATVPLGQAANFLAYAVGSVNSGITYQVNGVTGGSTATGTITTLGTYTAPAAFPITGPTVTITAVSQADSTRSASATVTLM